MIIFWRRMIFFDFIQSCCNLCVKERIESDHLPLEFHVNIPGANACTDEQQERREYTDKFVWINEYAVDFVNMMNSEVIHVKLLHAYNLLDLNVNEALQLFNNTVKQAADCMKQQVCINRVKRKDEWFDLECRNERQKVRTLLRTFGRTLHKEDRQIFCVSRKEYKNLLQRKRKAHNKIMFNEIVLNINNQQCFWKSVHAVFKKQVYSHNSITMDEWRNHF
jgi:hypothetical protein